MHISETSAIFDSTNENFQNAYLEASIFHKFFASRY